jgi:hypothetical protein
MIGIFRGSSHASNLLLKLAQSLLNSQMTRLVGTGPLDFHVEIDADCQTSLESFTGGRNNGLHRITRRAASSGTEPPIFNNNTAIASTADSCDQAMIL